MLAAFGRVPRERFVPEALVEQAYDNEPLPIGERQTISQPLVVALMLEALQLRGERVLEVGTGSGYQTALLAEMGTQVVSVERSPELRLRAARTLDALGYRDVRVREGDGSLGWPDAAPYDGIVVSAGAPYIPDALVQQLGDGGRLVIPVGPSEGQELVRLERAGARIRATRLGPVRFVPLVGAAAWGAPFSNGSAGPAG